MSNKEDSSFLQGVESRLDSLFGEDSGASAREKEPVEPKAAAQDIPEPTQPAPEVKEDIREIPIVKTPGTETPLAAEKAPSQDKSTFISEIEKRFSAIFGEDEKEASPVKADEPPIAVEKIEKPPEPDFAADAASIPMEEPPAVKMEAPPVADVSADKAPALEARPPVEEPKPEASNVSEFVAPVSSIYNSPLKDIKSIVLSIEWEISDHILEQFDEEVNKLYLLYTGNRILQGFLRILRFLGRYIRVRGVSSNQDSINLLLSVYDHLETVMISEGMTEANKHIILIDNIKKYRTWVETTDIEPDATAPQIEEIQPPVEEPVSAEKREIEIPELKIEPAPAVEEPEPPRLQLEEREEIRLPVAEPELPPVVKPAAVDFPIVSWEDQNTILEAMKGMPMDEAVKYAVEEIKNIYQAELDALKEEIRMLKGDQ